MPDYKKALDEKYEAMKAAVKAGHYTPTLTTIFGDIFETSIQALKTFKKVPLTSKVSGKTYVAYENDAKKISRAINAGLFDPTYARWKDLLDFMGGKNKLTPQDINKCLYSVAISFCTAIDLFKQGDQKTPGTYFEHFVAYFFAWRVGVEPKSAIQVLHLDEENTELQTDFIFNLGKGKPKFHMPIKTSTRERAIMLWAHQRLLDGVYGTERFLGTPVLLAETKTDSVKREVVEICLPEQWRLYQLYIAKLRRIYYLDLPTAYAKLNDVFPPIAVKQFGDFFVEWKSLGPG